MVDMEMGLIRLQVAVVVQERLAQMAEQF